MVETLNQNTIDLEKRAIVSIVLSRLQNYEGTKTTKTVAELDTASTLKNRYSSADNLDFKSISYFPDLSIL